MKQLLLIIAMLIGCVCFGQKTADNPIRESNIKLGQKKDTLPVTKENGLTIIGGLNDSAKNHSGYYNIIRGGHGTPYGVSTSQFGFGNENYNKKDTVKVIMLVCDTSFVTNHTSIVYLSNINGYTDTIGYIKNRIPYTWWQFGYTVIDREGFYNYNYLDQNKKPLAKSIVVWISKEIN